MVDVIIQAFVDRIKAGLMEIEQVPVPYRDRVREKNEEE